MGGHACSEARNIFSFLLFISPAGEPSARAETGLKGLKYYGTTASGGQPKQSRAIIYRTSPLHDPLAFFTRLLTLQWGPVDGTIAADTDYYPLGWGKG